ncbi:TetR/AcrR family transcriptional regulator [Streptomyces sp. HPF1205]|uniref:TetR/AcrR family transcriptional regulator n=1 Tax=Streptomyces sp. HPF1205 TaxID=2873262 RepID=UPI001CEDF025|nr:TetR/AcrR family transcriptional regulator [Streptomyces sp. HPF1205]
MTDSAAGLAASSAVAAGTAPPPPAAPPPDPRRPDAAGPAGGRRGRPRNAAVDSAVIEAVLRLVSEGTSIAELSMESVAKEAGVGKATVYRRWPGKGALLLDVLTAVEEPPPEPAGRDLREDLIAQVDGTRRRNLAKQGNALLRNMLMYLHSSPELWARYYEGAIVPRRRVLARLLEHGVATGELRPAIGEDLELAVDMVVGPVLYRATIRPDRLTDETLPERIVNAFLEGARAA